MNKLPNKGNIVLHVSEMLNAENKPVKVQALEEMRQAGIKVNVFAHDCACMYRSEFQGTLCKVCLLDSFHWKGHTCDCGKVEDPTLNSQAAEQLWGRLDRLHFASEYSRARYRYFFKEYFIWRNNWLRSSISVDVNPCVSRRGLIRHR